MKACLTRDALIEEAMKLWEIHALLREGKRNKVYKDSLGKLTVGIGHLVTPDDNLKFGDTIDEHRIKQLFRQDSDTALKLAVRQMLELKKKNPNVETPEFLAALISVNFQLGDWSKVFYNSYPALVRGDVSWVTASLNRSTWQRQTPVRVADFIKAIEKAYV